MTDHQALFSLLRQANPVPDPAALLETPGSTKSGAIPERNHTMPSTQATIGLEPKPTPTRRRRSLVLAASAFVVVVLAGVFALLRPDSAVLAPSEVATSFFEAINQNDPDAWWALHTDDAIVFGQSLTDETARQTYQDYFDWRTTLESQFEDVECTETGSLDTETGGSAVSCDYVWRGAIQDRLGVTLTGYMLMAVDNGKIVKLSSDSPNFDPLRGFPIRYLSEHHSAEFDALCGGGPGAFNGGEECARLYMDNLDAMAEAWESENR